MKFLTTPATTFGHKLKFLILAFLITWLWNGLMRHFTYLLYPALIPSSVSVPIEVDPDAPPLIFNFFIGCILAPLWEELAFRHAPGLIIKAMGRDVILPIMIISSAIFGWIHGNGVHSIMFQGVGGFILFSLYLKNGYSYWSSVALHFLWNAHLFFSIGIW